MTELLLTERDIQFLIGVHALATTLLSPRATEQDAEHNFEALHELIHEAYSDDEINVLGRRLRAALPPGSVTLYAEQDDDDTLLPPSSGLVS